MIILGWETIPLCLKPCSECLLPSLFFHGLVSLSDRIAALLINMVTARVARATLPETALGTLTSRRNWQLFIASHQRSCFPLAMWRTTLLFLRWAQSYLAAYISLIRPITHP